MKHASEKLIDFQTSVHLCHLVVCEMVDLTYCVQIYPSIGWVRDFSLVCV
jgi:hypothetical protein